jgi:Ala-tRNA(Pro) deacylase
VLPARPTVCEKPAQASMSANTESIQFEELRRLLTNDVDMANEEQVETLFLDCDPGAVPALGAAYGLNVVVDDSLARQPDVYFESGDHSNLVHISGTSFQQLMADARHGLFTGRG